MFQIFYTGGIYSPSLLELVIPPLLGYFYRPIRDRYIFMGISAVCIVIMWLLTHLGVTENLVEAPYQTTNSLLANAFTFLIVMIFALLFRRTLARRNRQLSNSLDELRIASEKLVHSEKMASLGMMSAGIAHEINNPLNFIKGGSDMLARKFEGNEEAKPFIDAVSEGVKRASSIVSSLGHFSRETTEMTEICDVHKIIDNCLVMLQHKLKHKATIKKNYSVAKHLSIIGNEGRLHQAILNILSNSEQALTEKGKILVQTRAKKGHLKLTISDNGTGISQENLSKISDPFFTTKESGKGTGLGLAITYRILHEHGAIVRVDSEEGKGTEFTILFPLPKHFN